MNDIVLDKVKEQFSRTWQSPSGLTGWIATVNSRPLGERYLVTSLAFFTAGIILALLIRAQLAIPDNHLIGPNAYNGVFTMHGSTMLYLFAVPFIESLGVYFLPLLVGSRDLAFPRLTNLGYWLYLFGGLTMYASVLFGAVPDAAWTAYPPLSGPKHSGIGLDFWILGLGMLEIAGIGAAVEIVVTIIKLRAPGMAIQHMPVIVWTYLVTGIMIIFAFTPLLIVTLMLEMDRTFGTQFFNPDLGGNSLLWQHLFWWFGHPEVYIIFLPATGVISAIIPVFTKRRLVAYPFVIAAIIITGFVSFGLWTHHMFTTGIPELPMHFFTAASYMIAIASGVQVFAWIATLWGGKITYSVQMLFIISFFIIFVNGGITGVMVATMSFDWQVHDTNFVVAHFHHVLIGGAVLPLLAGLYHWLPKISGRMFSKFWGTISIGLIFFGFNLTFVPLYIAGLLGMRRRIYTYPEEMGVGTLNLFSTVGAFILATGFFITLLNLLWHYWLGRKCEGNPWNAGTLEWAVESPAPPYGFSKPPVVRDRYPNWKVSHPEENNDPYTQKLHAVSVSLDYRPCTWRASLLTDLTNAHPQTLQYLPGPTLIPFFIAVAILITTVGIMTRSYILSIIAGSVALALSGVWALREPVLPQDEANELTKNISVPLYGSGTKSLGWWAMTGFIVILFMVLTTFQFSYYYLRLYSQQWPQDGLPLPDLTRPIIASIILGSGAIIQLVNWWNHRKGRRKVLVLGLSITTLLGIGFISLLIYSMTKVPFAITANAYASIFFTLNAFAIVSVVTSVTMQIAVVWRILKKKESLETPRLVLWLQNNGMLWYFAIFNGLATLFTTYLSPYVL